MTDSEWKALHRKLFLMAYNIYKTSREDAEDLAQDIICQHLVDKDIKKYSTGYWGTVMRNRIFSLARRESVRQRYFPRMIRATVQRMTVPDPYISCYLHYVLSYPEARTLLAININRGGRNLTAAERVVQYRLRRRLRAKVGGGAL